uniref:Env protein n=1 Tax=Drosophila melanogaster TaxID=7227 RepID=Q5K600_DROME|nr:env protein [Drosophila melanogaster]
MSYLLIITYLYHFRFTLVPTQAIHVHYLNDNAPIAKIELGKALLIERYKIISHVINLQDYSRCMEQFHLTINKFNPDSTLTDSVTILKAKLTQAQVKLKALTPSYRNKRGLINGLGSLVKVVTGNMDANDNKEIHEELDNIKKNSEVSNDNLQKQVMFNNEILIRFENITDHINNEQILISKFFDTSQNKIYKHLNLQDTLLEEIQYLNRINYNIELFINHLNDITESMLLAKINIIPKFILNEQEMDKIKTILEKQNITVKNEQSIYNFLQMNTLNYEQKIIFNIKVPIFKQPFHTLARLVPLPINNTYFVITPNYLAYNINNKKFHMTRKCPKLDNTFLCDENFYVDTPQNNTCLEHLLNGENSSCDVRETGPITDVFEAERGYIFAFNVNKLKVSLTNGSELSIMGSAIIRYINETIQINGIDYDGTVDTFPEQTDFDLPPMRKVTRNTTITVLSLEKLHLEATQTMDKILAVHHNTIQHTWTLYTLLGLVTFLAVILWLHRRTKHIVHIHEDHHVPIYASSIPSLWPSLRTGGGGVTTPPPKPPRL